MSDFQLTTSSAVVSANWLAPDDASAVLVLAHGAGAGMHHQHMEALANALLARNIATLRFNFPFMESGKRRTDPRDVCLDTLGAAVDIATNRAGAVPLFAGGHSFGGRMASHLAAERPPTGLKGLVYFSFPLHPSGRPSTGRAAHLANIRLPQLFVSGTRDALADLTLLRQVVGELAHARLHEVDTADHSFKILKRKRSGAEDVYTEAARVAREFMRN